MPAWNGNEFLLPDGSRPAIRTLTPLRIDTDGLELDVEVVLHRPAGRVGMGGAGGTRRGRGDLRTGARLRHRHRCAGVPPRRRRDRDPGDVPVARSAAGARPRFRSMSRSRTPTRASRSPRIRAQRSPGWARARCTAPATRSSPPSAPPRWSRARACGSPAKPRRCNASAATCSRSGGCPAPRPLCAATGSTVAPATPTTPTDQLRRSVRG